MENEGRIFDIIPTDTPVNLITPGLDRVLKQCRLYELVSDGVIKENKGIKPGKNSYLFYDVSGMNQVFKESYKGIIKQINVTKVLSSFKQSENKKDLLAVNSSHGESETRADKELLSLDGSYRKLSIQEKNSLGYNFVSVRDTEKGLEVKPVVVKLNQDMYLDIDTKTVEPELLEKINSDITTLVQNEYGFYAQSESLSNQKSL